MKSLLRPFIIFASVLTGMVFIASYDGGCDKEGEAEGDGDGVGFTEYLPWKQGEHVKDRYRSMMHEREEQLDSFIPEHNRRKEEEEEKIDGFERLYDF